MPGPIRQHPDLLPHSDHGHPSGHAARCPSDGNAHIPNEAPDGWQTIAPSALAFGGDLPKVPRAVTLNDIARVRQGFIDAARRVMALELHFAHGYLA